MKKREMRKLFDAEFYLRANPDVAAARMDPLEHYREVRGRGAAPAASAVRSGALSGRLPGGARRRQSAAAFSGDRAAHGRIRTRCSIAKRICSAHPDARANPLVHYRVAVRCGRQPVRAMLEGSRGRALRPAALPFLQERRHHHRRNPGAQFLRELRALGYRGFRRRGEPGRTGVLSPPPSSA